MQIFTTKPDCEKLFIRELKNASIESAVLERGIVSVPKAEEFLDVEPCFSSWQLINPVSFDKQTKGKPFECAVNWFCNAIREEKITSPWILAWLTTSDNGCELNKHKSEVLRDFIKKRVSRVAGLAKITFPVQGELSRGLIVLESDKTLFLSRNGIFYGQKRMKDDPAAPSRSFLKIEEAFSVFRDSPKINQTVADLGAAPGGWSWSAAKRGAHVFAIDNGPLKKGALDQPLISHFHADAFVWKPQTPVDWLLCDLVEEPSRVIDRIRLWLSNRWCSYAVINLKYGHADPVAVFEKARGDNGFKPFVSRIICRQLYHDRDEITVMTEVSK